MYTDSMKKMIKAAMTAEMLDIETEQCLAYAWREYQDVEARNRLVTAHMRLAIAMTDKYLRYGVPRSDLIQEANMALLRAAEKFDPDRESRFSTYVMLWIKSALQEYVMRNWSLVSIGKTKSEKSLFFKLPAVQKKLQDEAVARSVTTNVAQLGKMIAQEVGVPERDVVMMQNRLSGSDQSLNSLQTKDIEGSEWIDVLPDESCQAAETFAEQHDTAQLRRWIVIAFGALKERERQILLENKCFDTPRTLKSLGDELGISEERARQIKSAAFTKMRKNLQTQAPEAQQLLFI